MKGYFYLLIMGFQRGTESPLYVNFDGVQRRIRRRDGNMDRHNSFLEESEPFRPHQG